MKNLCILLIIGILLSSCENVFFEPDLTSHSPRENFEYLWNECNEKYAYFELKGVDWNAIKSEYESKIFEGMSEEELFKVLGDMLEELKDGHTNLISNFDVSNYRIEDLGQDNYDSRILHDNYLSENVYYSGPFSSDFLHNGDIGYVRFPEFTGTVNESNLDFVLERFKDTKGLVLDLRENGGGDIEDVFEILSRFIETETLVNYSRIKTGPGHNEFSEAEPIYVSPYEGIRYKNKVAVLIDRGTYSAGSFTAIATKALPNMVLIGDVTGGGLGLPNGGQLPNGWSYRFSITQALTLDKKPDYEDGVPPDIQVLFDWNDLTKDEILERAIVELL